MHAGDYSQKLSEMQIAMTLKCMLDGRSVDPQPTQNFLLSKGYKALAVIEDTVC